MNYSRLCVFLLVVLCGCTINGTAADRAPGNDAAVAGSSALTFVHLNDTYRIGAVESGKAGGFGRVVTVVKALQAEGREVRILHGGDFLYPSLESQLWNGRQMIAAFNFMNDVAPMYAVAGNHEFDRRTPEHLVNAVTASRFKWLGDNYRFATGDESVDRALQQQYVFEHAGRRIGFLALTLHPAVGGNDRAYVPIDADYLAAARRVLDAYRAAGIDAVVGLTHLHMWQDREVAALKADYPELLFIVGGHEHEPEYDAATSQRAAIMKGASNARTIWRIDIDFDAQGKPRLEQAKQIALDETIVPDPDYEQLAAAWRQQLLQKFPFLEARVGTAAVPLDGREVTIRNQESNWGNFIVDQMLTAFGGERADFAFINSGTLRIDDFVSGDITFEDIGRTFGFSSWLRYTTLTGAEFRAVIEAGFRGSGPSKGYFPQVAGFRLCVDRSRADFERIVSLQRPTADGWEEVADDADYDVVISDFLYGGGDGYRFPESLAVSPPGSELKYRVLDAIMAAQAEGRAVGERVDPANPRIVILGPDRERCFD